MKNLTLGFLLSILIHAICLSFFLHKHEKEKFTDTISVELYPEVSLRRPAGENRPDAENPAVSSAAQSGGNVSGGGKPSASETGPGTPAGQPGMPIGPDGIEYSKEPRYIPVPDTTRSLLFSWKKPAPSFKETLVGKPLAGEDVKKKVEAWFSSAGTWQGGTRPDPAADYIKKQSGASPVFALPAMRPAEKKKVEQNPPRFDFIPNPVQLNAMASLYKKKQATQTDIYANLDASLRVTAEGLDANLEFLVKKGFLKRKKISPENLFTFFGAATVEMSRKNKLNPLYVYTPSVDRTTLISYFQSQIYVLKEKEQTAPSDSLYLHYQIDNLQSMIQVLIQTT